MSSLHSQSYPTGFNQLASQTLANPATARPAMLAALTDLFVSRDIPDGEEICRYEELALQLLPHADASTRAHVAARLARHPYAPVPVIDALLQADRACATIMIEHCQRLPDGLLAELALTGTVDEAYVIARRPQLPANISDTLSQRRESVIHLALAENPDVSLEGVPLDRLLQSARSNDDVARALCARITDTEILTPLFLNANAGQRAIILRDAELANFSAARISRIETASEVLTDWIIERGRKGYWSLVAQEMARLTRFDRAIVDKLLADPRGDGLAILLACIGCPVEKAIRLFLTCPPQISHSYERVHALAQIVETMPAHAAHGLVDSISGASQPTARPRHMPLNDPAAKPLPGRSRTGLSSYQMPASRILRTNIRLQR